MALIIPGSEVPIPAPDEGFRYGEVHAARIAANLAALRETYVQWEKNDTIPETDWTELGSGSSAIVYRAGNYALREPFSSKSTAEYANDLVRGIGAEGLEQIRAVSKRHTYSDFIDGKDPSEATSEDIAPFDTPELNRTLDRVTTLQARGLGMETMGNNVRIRPTDGIKHHDYEIDPKQPLDVKVSYIAHIIRWVGLPDMWTEGRTVYRAAVADRIPVLTKLDELVRKRAEYAPQFWGPSALVTGEYLQRARQDITSRK